jgi:hypothetical protein
MLNFAKNDRDLFNFIADFKFLTVSQLSALSQRSRQVIRRRLRFFVGENVVETRMRAYGRGRGRPEELIFLTEKGREFLKDKGILSDNAADITDKAKDSIFIDHDFLVSWFRIHLVQIERVIPQLSVHYLTSRSNTFTQSKDDRHLLHERVSIDSSLEKYFEFIPDGVFSITNHEAKPKRTLLFYLEVDMGTETMASADRGSKDVRQKIINYQALFLSGHYKRYEPVFDAKLNGFRLLIFTNTPARSIALCHLVKEMPPSNFVWLTDQERMFSYGLSGYIWAQGGRHDDPLQSILGSKLACSAPVLNSIK